MTMRTVRRIIVHHSAGSWARDDAEDARAEHILVRKWSDLGYHFVIDRNGVHLGRPLWMVGAHDQGQNDDSVGVMLVGDWRAGHDGDPRTKAPAAWAQLVRIVADLCDWFDLDTALGVEGHRENEPATTATECPGFEPGWLRTSVTAERQRRRREAPSLYPYTSKV